MPRPRGAIPSPRSRAFAAHPHVAIVVPDPFGVIPMELSYWDNSTYGDCVSAEEAFAKAAYAVQTGHPELFITQAEVVSWASAHGYLNGAVISQVMDTMATQGMVANDGKTYTDGPPQSVDWTNDVVLRSAIFHGPVKIGVAASQLESVVGISNGWVATGFRHDSDLDHCVSLCGYGTMAALAAMLGVHGSFSTTARGYLLFTWSTVGIIDQPSLLAITGEAWLRLPTTPQQQPGPTPTPPPHHPQRHHWRRRRKRKRSGHA